MCHNVVRVGNGNPKDLEVAALVGELPTASREFPTWWSAANPQTRTTGTKNFTHPVAGSLVVDWEAFAVPDEPTHTLFVYTAADPESEAALKIMAS